MPKFVQYKVQTQIKLIKFDLCWVIKRKKYVKFFLFTLTRLVVFDVHFI